MAQNEELLGVASAQPPSPETNSLSADRTIGYATVRLSTTPLQTENADVVRIVDTAQVAAASDLEVAVGGDAAREASAPEGGSELGGDGRRVGHPLVLFGNLLAPPMPILSAVLAVSTAVGLASLAFHLVGVPSYTTPMMMLVGLGVGIDYALLLLNGDHQGNVAVAAGHPNVASTPSVTRWNLARPRWNCGPVKSIRSSWYQSIAAGWSTS